MKTPFILFFLFLFSVHANAQITSFYTAETSTNFNKKTGYNILKSNQKEGKIAYKSLNENVIDVEISWRFEKINATPNDVVSLTFGEDKTVTLQYYIKTRKSFIIENGKSTEVNFIDSYSYQKGFEQHNFMLRITPDYFQIMQTGELGHTYFLKPLAFDSRDFVLEAQANTPLDVNVSLLEYHFSKLTCVAKNNLSIRASNSLSSKKIGSIPYGEAVIVLNKTAQSQGFKEMIYNEVVDTKGNIKVDDLSSKMIKILYKGQIGYAYGGYLLPIRKYKKGEDDKYFPNLSGWTSSSIIFDQMFDNEYLAFKSLKIDFRDDYWKGLSASQRGLVLKKLFPNLKMFEEKNFKKLIQSKKIATDDEENPNPVLYADYKEVEYIENEIDEALTSGILHFNKNEPIVFEYIEKSYDSLEKLGTKTAYITASTLNMRQTSDPKSDIIAKIPFGEKVEKQYQSVLKISIIGNLRGAMKKVKYGNQTGYVFDAYLSPIQPPKRKMSSYDINKMIRKSTILEHFSDNGIGRTFCKTAHYSPNWTIVYARDKHQIVKAFRKAFPNLEMLKFKWDEKQQDYNITTNSNKITIHQTTSSWCIVLGNETDDERPIIIIETIDKGIQKVTIVDEFMGD